MCQLIYYKIGRQWFLDLPDYRGYAEDLEVIGSFYDFLEMVSHGDHTLVFEVNTQPFEGAEVLSLTGSSGAQTGGYYHLSEYEGHPVDMEFWYNRVLYFFCDVLPSKIYFKQGKGQAA